MTENMPVTQKTRALAPSEKMRQATSTPYVLEKIERVLGKGKNAEMFIASIMDISNEMIPIPISPSAAVTCVYCVALD